MVVGSCFVLINKFMFYSQSAFMPIWARQNLAGSASQRSQLYLLSERQKCSPILIGKVDKDFVGVPKTPNL